MLTTTSIIPTEQRCFFVTLEASGRVLEEFSRRSLCIVYKRQMARLADVEVKRIYLPAARNGSAVERIAVTVKSKKAAPGVERVHRSFCHAINLVTAIDNSMSVAQAEHLIGLLSGTMQSYEAALWLWGSLTKMARALADDRSIYGPNKRQYRLLYTKIAALEQGIPELVGAN